MIADSDLREQAIARLFEPVDKARAVFNGHVLVGHRDSVMHGEMLWAVPGGRIVFTATLTREDPNARVIEAPHPGWLRDQRPVLRELMS